MPIFGVVCSKSRCSRQLVNCQFDCCLVLSAGPSETRNQKLRPLTYSFRCHECNGGLRISNEPPLEITSFEISPLVLIYVKL